MRNQSIVKTAGNVISDRLTIAVKVHDGRRIRFDDLVIAMKFKSHRLSAQPMPRESYCPWEEQVLIQQLDGFIHVYHLAQFGCVLNGQLDCYKAVVALAVCLKKSRFWQVASLFS